MYSSGPTQISRDLTVQIVGDDTSLTIEFGGELDLAARDAVRRAITTAFERRPRRLVLDLSGLTFMDSTGVHAAIEAGELAAANDVDLILIPGSPAIRRLLALVDLGTAFSSDESLRPTSQARERAPEVLS